MADRALPTPGTRWRDLTGHVRRVVAVIGAWVRVSNLDRTREWDVEAQYWHDLYKSAEETLTGKQTAA